MNTSVIRHRVADFLKRYPPFDVISEPDLLDLAGSGRVKFHESEEYILRQGDAKGPVIWVIEQGRVELLENGAAGEQLRDVVGEGDLLGLERFAGDGSCRFSARTASDVILYGINGAKFEALVPQYPLVKRFLSAHSSVSGVLGFGRTSWLDADAPSAEFVRARLVALPGEAAREEIATRLIDSRNAAAALVDGDNHPIAIVTPAGLCDATTSSTHRAPTTIATPTTRAAVREMLRARTEELAITADGTLDSPLEGILTASELALFCGHNPVRLVSSIRRAVSSAEMMPLLRRASRLILDGLAQPVDVDDCCRIGTEVVSAVADACVNLARADLRAAGTDAPAVPYCIVLFGPSARGDLLEPRIPTIAAVYDDTDARAHPLDSMYFAPLAGSMANWVDTFGLTGAGLSWPEGSQPSMPLSEWKRLYSETIGDPLGNDLYARREFFDMRSVGGDSSILSKLHEDIIQDLSANKRTISLLANDTLGNLPPLTFFQGLVLALDGSQRDSLDIGATAVSPIADAARVFALAKGRLSRANTLDRLEAAALDFPEGETIFREAASAFRIALYYQTLAGGAQIDPGKLGKFDQLLLKMAFSSIHRLLEFTTSTFMPAR